jgi:hypothetical protein
MEGSCSTGQSPQRAVVPVGVLCTSGLCLLPPPPAGSIMGSSLKVSANLFSVNLNRFMSGGSWAFGDSPQAFAEMVHITVAIRHTVNCDGQFLPVALFF